MEATSHLQLRYQLLLWPLSFLQCWWLWQWWCSCCLLQVLSECVTLWSHQRWFAFLVILLLNISWQCVCVTLETHPQIQSHSSWWWWLWLCLRSLASWWLDLVLHLIIGMKWRLSQAGTAHHNSRLTVTVTLSVTVWVPVRYGEAKAWVHMYSPACSGLSGLNVRVAVCSIPLVPPTFIPNETSGWW